MATPQLIEAAASVRKPEDVIRQRENRRAFHAGLSALTQPKQQGMSDGQLKLERRVQDRLFAAVAEMRAALADADAGSEVFKHDGSFEDWLHDNAIKDPAYWDARIAEMRA